MIHIEQREPNDWCFRNLASTPELEEDFYNALEVFDSGDIQRAEDELKLVCGRCPCHIDAIHHLGLIFYQTGRPFESYLCAQEASRLGLEALPPEFSWQTARLKWGVLDNRPFMLAYLTLGLWHLRYRETSKATTVFGRLMAADPNDHLGARYLLMHCYLSASAWEDAIELTDDNKDDSCPDFPYSGALALFSTGRIPEGEAMLESACASFPLVAEELLKRHHARPASQGAGYISHGGADRAYEYWKWNGQFWRNNKQAMRSLAATFSHGQLHM